LYNIRVYYALEEGVPDPGSIQETLEADRERSAAVLGPVFNRQLGCGSNHRLGLTRPMHHPGPLQPGLTRSMHHPGPFPGSIHRRLSRYALWDNAKYRPGLLHLDLSS
jgi:hypothetical protein